MNLKEIVSKNLKALRLQSQLSQEEFAKKSGLSHSNVINKAHRQTIEAFLEKGIWKIGAP